MSKWVFSCGCGKSFKTEAIEGGLVMCFNCGRRMTVPICTNLKNTEDYSGNKLKPENWEIWVICPQCRTKFITNKSLVGKEAMCRKCDYEFNVIADHTKPTSVIIAQAILICSLFASPLLLLAAPFIIPLTIVAIIFCPDCPKAFLRGVIQLFKTATQKY